MKDLENYHYLAERAEDCLPAYCSDSGRLDMSNGTITVSAFLPQESETEYSQSRPSSAISAHSSVTGTPQAIRDWLTSLQQDSLVSHSVLPESRQEQTIPAICGLTPSAVYKSSDPNMSFSKMFLDSYQRDPKLAYVAGLIDGEGCIGIQSSNKGSQYYVEITIGMAEKAKALLLQIKEHFGGTVTHHRRQTKRWANAWKWRIGGDAALSFLEMIAPYLTLKYHQGQVALMMKNLYAEMKMNPNGTKKWTDVLREKAKVLQIEMHNLNRKGPGAHVAGGGWYQPMPNLFGTWEPFSGIWRRAGMMHAGEFFRQPSWERRISEIGCGLWPTPHGFSQDGKSNGPSGNELGWAVNHCWPTPKASMRGDCPSERRRRSPDLVAAVHLYVTPQARDYRTGEQKRWENPERSRNLNDQIGGQLNPTWVEWLMNWPIGWTSLEPLQREAFDDWLDKSTSGTWWQEEPRGVPRVAVGVKDRVSRLRAIGNGQVSLCAALAFFLLDGGGS